MKKNKDVLFMLQFFYPEYNSSATLPYDTALQLSKSGMSVDVLCGYPREYCDIEDIPCREIVNNINIHRLKYIQLNRGKKLARLVNYLSLTVSMFFHIFEMRKYKTIIVYSNPPILPFVAALASKLFHCKLVFVAYDLYPEVAIKTDTLSNDSIITKLMNFINKFVFKQVDAVVALSNEMKDYIVQNRNISMDKIHVIPNWYKDEYSDDKYDDNRFESIVKDRLVVSYLGNMGIAQDMECIKEATRYFKNDEDVCFFYCGHGSKFSEIEEMIKNEKIENAYLYGFLKGKDYTDALRISDCAIISLEKGLTGLCVPSKTYGYMMQGLPIIAIMDDSDIVNDAKEGAGYHVPNNSTDDLIEVIIKIKNKRLENQEKGKNSRQIYLNKYTPEICLDKYVRLLSHLVDGK